MSFGLSVTSSGFMYFEFSFSINLGNFSFVNSYGVFPPKMSLGILLILSSNLLTSSFVKFLKVFS